MTAARANGALVAAIAAMLACSWAMAILITAASANPAPPPQDHASAPATTRVVLPAVTREIVIPEYPTLSHVLAKQAEIDYWFAVAEHVRVIDAQAREAERARQSEAAAQQQAPAATVEAPARAGPLTEAEVRSLAIAAGFSGWGLEAIVDIAWCESRFDPNTTGAQGERGLTQVHPRWHPDATYDPLGNMRAAYRISSGGTDFGAWTCARILGIV